MKWTAQDILKMFYPCLLMVNRIKNPTKYTIIEDPEVIKNYFVVGNLGAGKSTMCNKIAHICTNGPLPIKKLADEFKSG